MAVRGGLAAPCTGGTFVASLATGAPGTNDSCAAVATAYAMMLRLCNVVRHAVVRHAVEETYPVTALQWWRRLRLPGAHRLSQPRCARVGSHGRARPSPDAAVTRRPRRAPPPHPVRASPTYRMLAPVLPVRVLVDIETSLRHSGPLITATTADDLCGDARAATHVDAGGQPRVILSRCLREPRARGVYRPARPARHQIAAQKRRRTHHG